MDIQEGRNMTQVKKTYVSQIDRFLEKHRGGDHASCYEVPDGPNISPILPARNTKWGRVILLGLLPNIIGGR